MPLDIAYQFHQAILQLNKTNSLVVIEYSLSLTTEVKSFEARLLSSLANQIIVIIRDITERKQAQEALQKAKEDLEIRVEERTFELKNANKLLRQEIIERQRIEEALKSSLQDKEVLLKEIHHRVKNNLQFISSLLRLQAGYIKNEQALDVLQDSQSRVRAMAMIHESLYQSNNLAKIGFLKYIHKLINNLIDSYRVNPNINIKSRIDNALLRIDTAIPCGLIINELISNSIKHAFVNKESGEIYVEFLMLEKGKYSLNVSDNGIGMKNDIKLTLTQSLGLQLVWKLVEQLEGNIVFNTNFGTSFKITFTE